MTLVPNLEILQLNVCSISRDSLIPLLQGCKNLSFITLVCCKGIEEYAEELWKLAKHIGKLNLGLVKKFMTL